MWLNCFCCDHSDQPEISMTSANLRSLNLGTLVEQKVKKVTSQHSISLDERAGPKRRSVGPGYDQNPECYAQIEQKNMTEDSTYAFTNYETNVGLRTKARAMTK